MAKQNVSERRYFIVAISEEEQTEDSGRFVVVDSADGRLISDGFPSALAAEEFIKEWDKF